ncbi:hypothetical protein PT274_05545 [Leuconostocaceae bacterium ESL0958]|nr:hypothetical protein [Leuconostocaceae bacterium ESL0958]
MLNKNFSEISMLDDFTLPVMVTDTLTEFRGIYGVSSQRSAAGVLTRKNGSNILELNIYPNDNKTNLENGEVQKVKSHEQGGTWYARSWDGKLNFVIRNYLNIAGSFFASNSQFGGQTSSWDIFDFSIQKKLPESNEFNVAEVDIGNLKYWFKTFTVGQDPKDISDITFNNLFYKENEFSLNIVAKWHNKTERYSLNKTVSLIVRLVFKENQTRDFIFDLSTKIRNFFQIAMGEKIGIQKILLNNMLTDEKGDVKNAEDAENWFVSQPVVFHNNFSEKFDYPINYDFLKDNMQHIFEKYLLDIEFQRFADTILMTERFNIPVEPQLITLVSAVESFFKAEKFENGKQVQDAVKKLQFLNKILDKPFEDNLSFYQRIKERRDFIIHGNEKGAYDNEIDLVPDLLKFKNILQKVLINKLTAL